MAASEIEKLERLVRENPKGRLFASLADAYRKDGQFPKALEVLEAGLKNHPDYVSARVVLGRVHMTTGDRVKAREAFSRVVELDPESVIALKALADLAEEDGESKEALRWSGQLLAVDPGNDDAMKQQERLAASAPPEVRLSGVVPMDMAEVADHIAAVVEPKDDLVLPGPVAVDREVTVRAFPAITAPIPTSAPTFNAAIEPLARAPGRPRTPSPLRDLPSRSAEGSG